VAAASRRAVHVFDLESTADLGRLTDPLLALESLRGWNEGLPLPAGLDLVVALEPKVCFEL
jgi:hypothetical protein